MLCTREELRKILLCPSGGYQVYPTEDCDEVYPGIYLGNAKSAADLNLLKKLGVGFVLNAAHGRDAALNMLEVVTPEEYSQAGIRFLGIPAIDMMSYPLHEHFEEASGFVSKALEEGKKVLVHCKQGISRSAALVLAYLIAKKGLKLQDATRMVREKREIFPNDGFIEQLCQLNEKIFHHP